MIAQLIDGFCSRYGQLPSAVLGEDAMTMLRLQAVLREGEHDG